MSKSVVKLKGLNNFFKGKSILDIYSGDGVVLSLLVAHYSGMADSIIGSEYYVKDTDELNKKYDNITFMVLKPEKDSIPEVDTIIINGFETLGRMKNVEKVIKRCEAKSRHVVIVLDIKGERYKVYRETLVNDPYNMTELKGKNRRVFVKAGARRFI